MIETSCPMLSVLTAVNGRQKGNICLLLRPLAEGFVRINYYIETIKIFILKQDKIDNGRVTIEINHKLRSI